MKLIGLIPLYDEFKDSLWMLPGYMEVIEKGGGTPIMFPLTENYEILENLVNMVDGILLTGGHDVNPKLYNDIKKEYCGNVCDLRDEMEKIVVEIALNQDKPIFGICRGIQFLNAYLGGTLYQDLNHDLIVQLNIVKNHHMIEQLIKI